MIEANPLSMQIELDTIPEITKHDYVTWKPQFCKIDAEITSYQEFFNNYMVKNLPCIIKNVSSSWNCAQIWVKDDGINYEHLINTYGSLDAPVANCSDINFNSQCKSEMKVEQYMEYMQKIPRERLLYLKDWHLKRTLPNDDFYVVPKMFASDWLNEFSIDNGEDDFMFVYIGPKDSWTPLHADVYCSYSWSVNITGRKKWIFLPPGEEEKIQDNLGNLPLMFKPEKYENVNYYEMIQEKGDVLFVPSGWHHQVVNKLDTISVNHNWINGCNILMVWNALTKSLKLVENEIEEFKDTSDYFTQCQIVLKSYFGMDFEMFFKFITYIGDKRCKQILKPEEFPAVSFNTYYFGKNHLKFDIISIKRVMDLILEHPHVIDQKIKVSDDFFKLKQNIVDLLEKD